MLMSLMEMVAVKENKNLTLRRVFCISLVAFRYKHGSAT